MALGEKKQAKIAVTFYVIESTGNQGVMGCELSRSAAHKVMRERGYARNEYTLDPVEVEVTAESIRRLLGNLGGYAS